MLRARSDKGETAVNTAYAAKARGGIMTLKDLADYQVIIREPVNISERLLGLRQAQAAQGLT